MKPLVTFNSTEKKVNFTDSSPRPHCQRWHCFSNRCNFRRLFSHLRFSSITLNSESKQTWGRWEAAGVFVAADVWIVTAWTQGPGATLLYMQQPLQRQQRRTCGVETSKRALDDAFHKSQQFMNGDYDLLCKARVYTALFKRDFLKDI